MVDSVHSTFAAIEQVRAELRTWAAGKMLDTQVLCIGIDRELAAENPDRSRLMQAIESLRLNQPGGY